MAEGKAAGVLAEGLPPCGGSGLKFDYIITEDTHLNVSLHAEGVD